MALLEDKDVTLLLEIANMACHLGFPDDAQTIAQAVLEFKPNFAPARITLAYSHIVVDKFSEALEILDDILAKTPNDAEALVMQGLAYLLSNRKDEAQKSFSLLPEGSVQKNLAEELSKGL